MVLVVLVALLAALGLAASLGLTADSRDADYSLGAVLRHSRPNREHPSRSASESAV